MRLVRRRAAAPTWDHGLWTEARLRDARELAIELASWPTPLEVFLAIMNERPIASAQIPEDVPKLVEYSPAYRDGRRYFIRTERRA